MPYSEQIPSQHPNATDHQKIAQASEILERLGRGESTRSLCAAMGISRGTMYARLELINEPLPTVQTVRRVHFERIETMIEDLQKVLDDDQELTALDRARLMGEQRQLLARQSALLRVETTDPPPPEPDDAPDPWVAGARDEAADELAEVESELRARRNGGG